MAKKYYSDITKKIYDDEATLEAEEKAVEERIALAKKEKEELTLARKEAAKEIEEATKKVNDAYKAWQEANKELIDKKKHFINKYGSYHYTTTNPEDPAFKYTADIIQSMDEYFNTFFQPFRKF